MVDHDLVAELYRTPPTEFVAVRTAKVAELRAAGQRESAARMAKLRRPSAVQWALNMTAGEHPAVVAAWADAAQAAHRAQDAVTVGEPADLREALATLRARTSDLIAAAAGRATTDALSVALPMLAASMEDIGALRAGVLGAGTVGPGRHEPLPPQHEHEAGEAAQQDAERRRAADLAEARTAVDGTAAHLASVEGAASDAAQEEVATARLLGEAADALEAARVSLLAAESVHAAAMDRHKRAREATSVADEELAKARGASEAAVARLKSLTLRSPNLD